MSIKRRISVLFAAGLILFLNINATAVTYPDSFWGLEARYQAAVNEKSHYDIIKYGKQEIELMKTLPAERDLYGAVGTRAIAVATSYEALNQYENSIPYHALYAECSEHMGWDDGVKVSTAKIGAFTSTIDLYTLTDEKVKFYGAKHEPETGTYFGQVYEASQSRDSMISIYQEYGFDPTLGWLNRALSEAKQTGKVVELALNFPSQGNQIDGIISDRAFISSFVDILRNYPDLKIFLRIGAEMNVWNNKPDAAKFKQAFIKIASSVRNFCSNVAIVWSVAHTSTNGVEMNDFYPGDEYVDWVGISAYGVKHFHAKYWDDNINEIYFKAGDGADPLRIVDEVLKKYGDRKPIMIAEGGSARYTNGSVNQSHEEWAKLNMLRFYSTLCMKYPQVKLMCYFNKIMPDELQYFEMDSVPSFKEAFVSITSSPWFIQNGKNKAMSFKPLDNIVNVADKLEIYALPYTFKDQQPRVDYHIDGQWIGAAVYLPYRAVLDLSSLEPGTHTLEAVVTSNGVEKTRKTYTINKIVKPLGKGEFYDTESLTNYEKSALKFAVERGIIDGYDDGTFKPDNTITRAEFATMTCRAYKYPKNGKTSFSDSVTHWASEYIKACTEVGAIDGIGNNLFSPDTQVLMAHATKIITVCSGFTDGKGIVYPYGYISAAQDKDIYERTKFYLLKSASLGKEVLSVNDLIEIKDKALTRIEVAVMFYNALNR